MQWKSECFSLGYYAIWISQPSIWHTNMGQLKITIKRIGMLIKGEKSFRQNYPLSPQSTDPVMCPTSHSIKHASLKQSSALLLYRCSLHGRWGKLTGSMQHRWSDAELTLYWSHKTSLVDWQKQPPVSRRRLLSHKNTKQLAMTATTDATAALK